MTAQIPETLIVENPRIDLRDLRLYAVIVGDPREQHGWGDGLYSLPLPPIDRRIVSTALHRGYIATFVLHEDGAVEFRSCQFVAAGATHAEDHAFGVRLVGDFWLVLKPRFFASRTYVPVRDGRVVEDRAQWVIEEPKAWHERS